MPVAAPSANLLFGKEVMDTLAIKDHLDIMKEASSTLLTGDLAIHDRPGLRKGLLTEPTSNSVTISPIQLDHLMKSIHN